MKPSLLAVASVLLAVALANPDGWEAPGAGAGAAPPLMRSEAADRPPADWDAAAAAARDDDSPQGQAQAQAQEASTVEGRQWAESDLETGAGASADTGDDASQVEYRLTRQDEDSGSPSHTYYIDPHLLADMPDANAVCGTPEQVHDCGFAWLAPVCTDEHSVDCVRGTCICTAEGGCDKPECEASEFDCRSHHSDPLPKCKTDSGFSCLTKPGTGWSCWHPCNMQHEVEDYGAQKERVKAIRSTNVCDGMLTVDRGGNKGNAADPNLLQDIEKASGFCGSQDLVATCGFSHVQDVCTGPDCFKGLCVCTGKDGCLEPICSEYSERCPHGLARCKGDGFNCLAVPGSNWSCWHPCNMEHTVQEFGHQASIVQALRDSGNCTRIGVQPSPPATSYRSRPGQGYKASYKPLLGATRVSSSGPGGGAKVEATDEAEDADKADAAEPEFRDDDATPGLDAGLMLRAQSWPLVPSGESTVNGGGASRRRADKKRQPLHNSGDEIKEVRDDWHAAMQGKAKLGRNGKMALYLGLFVVVVIFGYMLWKGHRKKKTEEEPPPPSAAAAS